MRADAGYGRATNGDSWKLWPLQTGRDGRTPVRPGIWQRSVPMVSMSRGAQIQVQRACSESPVPSSFFHSQVFPVRETTWTFGSAVWLGWGGEGTQRKSSEEVICGGRRELKLSESRGYRWAAHQCSEPKGIYWLWKQICPRCLWYQKHESGAGVAHAVSSAGINY